ncbi:unnamed protein product [Cochlearia groenlandica]
MGKIVYDTVLRMAKGCDVKFHLPYPSLIMRLFQHQGFGVPDPMPKRRRPHHTDHQEHAHRRKLKLPNLPRVKLKNYHHKYRGRVE